MKHWTAIALVVLLAAANLSSAQQPDEPTLPAPHPVAARPVPALPALAHEVGEGLDQSPEYIGLATAPVSSPPPIEETPERWWVRGEFLYWWVRHGPIASPLAVNESSGVGAPVIVGSDSGHFDPFPGGQFALGYWFNAERTWGAEVGGFFLQPQSHGINVQSDGAGNPPIVRPVTGPDGTPLLVPVSIPNILSGTLTSSESLHLSGIDANLILAASCGSNSRIEVLAGYRHLDLHESLTLVQTGQALAAVDVDPFGSLPSGTTLLAYDSIGTTNHFDGAQLGGRFECAAGPCYLRVSGDVDFGADSQVIRSTGATHVLIGTTPALLVSPEGIIVGNGQISREHASFVSSFRAEAGFIVTSHVRLFGAYSLLYWGSVVRPGEQVGFTAGQALPFRTSEFWAQGFSVGLEVRW